MKTKFFGGCLAGFMALAVGGAAYAADRPAAPPPTVRVTAVGMVAKSEPKSYVGVVAADATVHLVPRVSGTLEKAPFREGAIVKAGDLLYEIEDTVYLATLDIANAAIGQIEAELDLARKEHERATSLRGSGAGTEQLTDQTLRALRLAEAKQQEAKANVVLAENNLSYTKILAPVDGRIGENLVSVGNFVTPGAGVLATIVKFDPVRVRFSMSEADFFQHFKSAKEMVEADFSIERANGQPYTGEVKVDFIDNQVDSATGTLAIHLICANEDYQLLPGGYVRVRLAEKFAEPRPAVPLPAVMTNGQTQYVFVVGADNVAQRRDIETGPLAGGMQVVEKGLAAGERVITGGLNKVRPGQAVNPAVE